MTIIRTVAAPIFALALSAGFAAPSAAQEVRPVESRSLDLGSVAGDVYYTVKPDGYHVVATFAQRGDTGQPVRFESVLAPGQAVTFSSPRGAGVPPEAVTVVRQTDRVFVRRAVLTD